jgi:bisanhydrobacterioruberin hydratase
MVNLSERKITHPKISFAVSIAVSIFLFFMGFIRIVNAETREATIKMIPVMIIYSCLLVYLFSYFSFKVKDGIVLMLIALTGYLIEVAGVNTGVIFGHYSYGESLGIKLAGTPLIIGLNWLFLVYTSAALLENFAISSFLKVVLASFLMLLFDIVLEQLAPMLDMWYWNSGIVPLQNYIAWFIVALVFQFTLRSFHINTRNYMAIAMLSVQLLFFVSILIGIR